MSQKPVNKRTFTVKIGGKDVKLDVRRPNHKQITEGDIVRGRAFKRAVIPEDGGDGMLLKESVDFVMRRDNLWDANRQKEHDELVKQLVDGERRLAEGGFRLLDARDLAIQMRKDRMEMVKMRGGRGELEAQTAESYAEQSRFNYYVSACTVYSDNGNPYFKDTDTYLALSNKNDEVADQAAAEMAKLVYGWDENTQRNLPENQFLLKYGFCNEDLHLIRKSDGHLIDDEGRLVDKEGYYVNEDGKRVDIDGNLLDEEGNIQTGEFSPFLDEKDNPVAEPEPKKVETEAKEEGKKESRTKVPKPK